MTLELGLTQAQASKVLMINPSTVLNWETGRTVPPIRSVPAILTFLGYDPFPAPTTVGERLLQARRKRGWSIREAASHLGVDSTAWCDWEHGELILFHEHRGKVAKLLGLDAQVLADEMRARRNEKHLEGSALTLSGSSEGREERDVGVDRKRREGLERKKEFV